MIYFEVSPDLNRKAVEAAQIANPAVRKELIDALLAKLGERVELTAEQIETMRNNMVLIGGYAEPLIVFAAEDSKGTTGHLEIRLNVWADGICGHGLELGDRFSVVREMIEGLSHEIKAVVDGVPWFFDHGHNPPYATTPAEACVKARADMSANAQFVLELLRNQGMSDDVAKAMFAALYLELEQVASDGSIGVLHDLAMELKRTGGGLKSDG